MNVKHDIHVRDDACRLSVNAYVQTCFLYDENVYDMSKHNECIRQEVNIYDVMIFNDSSMFHMTYLNDDVIVQGRPIDPKLNLS